MSGGDTADYIRQHLTFAGRSDPLSLTTRSTPFTSLLGVIPRAVNNLSVAALIATYTADKAIVDMAAAQSAITENKE